MNKWFEQQLYGIESYTAPILGKAMAERQTAAPALRSRRRRLGSLEKPLGQHGKPLFMPRPMRHVRTVLDALGMFAKSPEGRLKSWRLGRAW